MTMNILNTAAATIPAWRATCIQVNSVPVSRSPGKEAAWKLIEANIARAVQAVESACDSPTPPRLVVLPEFPFTGPPHSLQPAEWIELACDTLPGRSTQPLQELAARRRIFIAGNLFEGDPRWPGRFFNSCFLINPQGNLVLRYRRINTALWPSPHDFLDAYMQEYGIEGLFPVVDTELGRLALVVCGEISVPEVSRAFMMRGAEVLLHPTNEDDSPGQEAAKTARASENMAYVVSANVAGPIGFSLDGSVVGGRSRIVNFRGVTLSYEAGAQETNNVSAMIDIEALRAARRDLGLANNLLRCRWEVYWPLFEKASFYPPNRFLNNPMAHSKETQAVSADALAHLLAAGIAQPANARAII
jgi:predicted amidohydrolase